MVHAKRTSEQSPPRCDHITEGSMSLAEAAKCGLPSRLMMYPFEALVWFMRRGTDDTKPEYGQAGSAGGAETGGMEAAGRPGTGRADSQPREGAGDYGEALSR